MPWLKREQQVKAKARDAEKVAKEAEQVLREAQTIAQQPNDKAGWMLNWIKTHAAEGLCKRRLRLRVTRPKRTLAISHSGRNLFWTKLHS